MGNTLKEFEQIFAEPSDYSTFLNLFNKYDKNKNGYLDKDEFEGFKKDLVVFIEKNSTGMKRSKEVQEKKQQVEQELAKRIEEATNAAKGAEEKMKIQQEFEVSTKLMNSIMESETQMLETLKSLTFSCLDVNKDGEISFNEFATELSKKLDKSFKKL